MLFIKKNKLFYIFIYHQPLYKLQLVEIIYSISLNTKQKQE